MSKNIIVYSKPDCMQCNFVKKWLDGHNVPYTEINVFDNEESLAEVKHYGYQTLPVVAVGTLDYAWDSFRPDRMKEEFL